MKKQVSFPKGFAFLNKLEEEGLNSDDIGRVVGSGELGRKIIELIRDKNAPNIIVKPTIGEVMASDRNFFSQYNWDDLADKRGFRRFTIPDPPPIVVDLAREKLSQDKGMTIGDTSFLFYLPEEILLDGEIKEEKFNVALLQRIFPQKGQPRFYTYEDGWYTKNKESFIAEIAPGWHLVRLEVFPGSTGKTLSDQLSILPEKMKLAPVIKEATKNLFFFVKNKEYLNLGSVARCLNVSSDGHLVNVGYFAEDGLRIGYYWDSRASGLLGASGDWDLLDS